MWGKAELFFFKKNPQPSTLQCYLRNAKEAAYLFLKRSEVSRTGGSVNAQYSPPDARCRLRVMGAQPHIVSPMSLLTTARAHTALPGLPARPSVAFNGEFCALLLSVGVGRLSVPSALVLSWLQSSRRPPKDVFCLGTPTMSCPCYAPESL